MSRFGWFESSGDRGSTVDNSGDLDHFKLRQFTFMFAGYPISLMLNGFAPQNSEILYAGIDDNENEYRVVELRDGGKIKEVAIFTKTFLPIWKKTQSVREADGLALGWIVSTGLKTYGLETVDINFAFHSVYCGNDAVKKIESISEYLPENTTAEIRQADESYSIHLTTYGDINLLNNVDLKALLSKMGYTK